MTAPSPTTVPAGVFINTRCLHSCLLSTGPVAGSRLTGIPIPPPSLLQHRVDGFGVEKTGVVFPRELDKATRAPVRTPTVFDQDVGGRVAYCSYSVCSRRQRTRFIPEEVEKCITLRVTVS